MKINYLIAYDVACSTRRSRVLRMTQGVAIDGQKSLYETPLSKTAAQNFAQWINLQIKPTQDQVLFLPVRNNVRILGKHGFGFTRYGGILA